MILQVYLQTPLGLGGFSVSNAEVWNLCPKGNAYNDDCNSRFAD